MAKATIHLVAIKDKEKCEINLCRDCNAGFRMKAKRKILGMQNDLHQPS
jgi:protein-arginine kinase activator protein McsA